MGRRSSLVSVAAAAILLATGAVAAAAPPPSILTAAKQSDGQVRIWITGKITMSEDGQRIYVPVKVACDPDQPRGEGLLAHFSQNGQEVASGITHWPSCSPSEKIVIDAANVFYDGREYHYNVIQPGAATVTVSNMTGRCWGHGPCTQVTYATRTYPNRVVHPG